MECVKQIQIDGNNMIRSTALIDYDYNNPLEVAQSSIQNNQRIINYAQPAIMDFGVKLSPPQQKETLPPIGQYIETLVTKKINDKPLTVKENAIAETAISGNVKAVPMAKQEIASKAHNWLMYLVVIIVFIIFLTQKKS